MAYIPQSGSVVAFQSDATKLEVGASIVGLTPVSISNTPTVNIGTSPGSIAAWLNSSSASVITVIQGSVATTITPAANQSVSGTVNVGSILTLATDQSVLGAISSTQTVSIPINGQAAVGIFVPAGFTGTLTPQLSIDGNTFSTTTMISVTSGTLVTSTAANGMWQANVAGAKIFQISGNVTAGVASVLLRASQAPASFMLDNPIPTGSNTIGNVGINGGTNNIGNINIRDTSGNTITATGGNLNVSVVGTVGTSIVGQLPAGTAPLGSVATLQGTNPWNIAGSVAAFQTGTWIVSVLSTIPSSLLTGVYAQRNDTVASFLGADLTWRPLATDSAGRNLIKPFAADENRLDTATSVVSTSVTALFNSVVGLRNYVTDIMIANTGSVATLVTFKDGSTSILGFTIAPAGGGSNINGMAMPLRTATAQDFTFTAGTASSVLYVTAKGYKAP